MEIQGVFQQPGATSQIHKRVPGAGIAGIVGDAPAKFRRLLNHPWPHVFTHIVFRGDPVGQHIRLTRRINGDPQLRLATLHCGLVLGW